MKSATAYILVSLFWMGLWALGTYLWTKHDADPTMCRLIVEIPEGSPHFEVGTPDRRTAYLREYCRNGHELDLTNSGRTQIDVPGHWVFPSVEIHTTRGVVTEASK